MAAGDDVAQSGLLVGTLPGDTAAVTGTGLLIGAASVDKAALSGNLALLYPIMISHS